MLSSRVIWEALLPDSGLAKPDKIQHLSICIYIHIYIYILVVVAAGQPSLARKRIAQISANGCEQRAAGAKFLRRRDTVISLGDGATTDLART